MKKLALLTCAVLLLSLTLWGVVQSSLAATRYQVQPTHTRQPAPSLTLTPSPPPTITPTFTPSPSPTATLTTIPRTPSPTDASSTPGATTATLLPTERSEILPDAGYVGSIPYLIIALIGILVLAGILLAKNRLDPKQRP